MQHVHVPGQVSLGALETPALQAPLALLETRASLAPQVKCDMQISLSCITKYPDICATLMNHL